MRRLGVITLGLGCGLLAGCAGMGAPSTSGPVQMSANLHGRAFGGQQPVVGATVQLWQASNTYGGHATGLLANGGVTTAADGSFYFPATAFSCTSGSMVYLTAAGGDPGGGTNPALGLMAALGLCDNVNDNTYVNINEVTTVGSVWALAHFMIPANQLVDSYLGAPPSNAAGLAAAFADVNTLVNVATGTAPGAGLPSGTSVPSDEIYAIANSLAACVNSQGALASGDPCTNLFSYATATYAGTTYVPKSTLEAAFFIVIQPSVHAQDILNLATTTPPFATTFTTASDLTLAVTYTGGGITAPSAVAIDAGGNVWLANSTANTVTELSHTGTVLSGASGYTSSLSTPSALAVDTSGHVWVANSGNSTLSELNSSGGTVTGSPYSGGGLSSPGALAFDGQGNLWVSNYGNNSASEFSATGTALSPATNGYTATGLSSPIGIAVSTH
jgi:hypothetical protein